MYEQTEVPVFRRIVGLLLWFVVIVALIWLAVWFIFFRNPSSDKSGSNKGSISQSNNGSISGNKSTNGSKTPNPSPTPSPSTPSPTPTTPSPTPTPTPESTPTPSPSTPTPTPEQQPSELVNTGAGDIIIPFALVSFIGSTVYYIRTVKKLNA